MGRFRAARTIWLSLMARIPMAAPNQGLLSPVTKWQRSGCLLFGRQPPHDANGYDAGGAEASPAKPGTEPGRGTRGVTVF